MACTDKFDGRADHPYYLTCETADDTVRFTITCTADQSKHWVDLTPEKVRLLLTELPRLAITAKTARRDIFAIDAVVQQKGDWRWFRPWRRHAVTLLVTHDTDPRNNGLWVVRRGSWSRPEET